MVVIVKRAATAAGKVFAKTKPFAEFNDFYMIADYAKETGRKLMVYQPHRAAAPANQIKNIIASGKIGKPYYIRFTRCGYVRRNDWQSLAKFGGGMLNNYGAHHIDSLLYVVEDNVRRLNCITYKIFLNLFKKNVYNNVFNSSCSIYNCYLSYR